MAEKHATELKNLGTVTDETKENADKALTAMNSIDTRLKDIEQKMSRRGGADDEQAEERKSLGQRFVETEEVKAALDQADKFRGKVSVELKNITSASTSGTSATTGLVPADRQGFIQIPNRPMTIRDLLMPGRTNSGFIEYPKESGFTNNAATVAENPTNPKPQSDITYTLVNTAVRTLAHFIMASRQILSDAPQLQSQIDGRLRYGLAYVEELQLLLGDGTGTNLLGLMPQATAYAAATTGLAEATGVTRIDRLRLALLQATQALYPSTGIVLNPLDWAAIELEKDSQGRYIFANPQSLRGSGDVGQAGRRIARDDREPVPVRRLLDGRADLRPRGCERPDLDRRSRQFRQEHGDDPRRGASGAGGLPPAALIKGNFTGAA